MLYPIYFVLLSLTLHSTYSLPACLHPTTILDKSISVCERVEETAPNATIEELDDAIYYRYDSSLRNEIVNFSVEDYLQLHTYHMVQYKMDRIIARVDGDVVEAGNPINDLGEIREETGCGITPVDYSEKYMMTDKQSMVGCSAENIIDSVVLDVGSIHLYNRSKTQDAEQIEAIFFPHVCLNNHCTPTGSQFPISEIRDLQATMGGVKIRGITAVQTDLTREVVYIIIFGYSEGTFPIYGQLLTFKMTLPKIAEHKASKPPESQFGVEEVEIEVEELPGGVSYTIAKLNDVFNQLPDKKIISIKRWAEYILLVFEDSFQVVQFNFDTEIYTSIISHEATASLLSTVSTKLVDGSIGEIRIEAKEQIYIAVADASTLYIFNKAPALSHKLGAENIPGNITQVEVSFCTIVLLHNSSSIFLSSVKYPEGGTVPPYLRRTWELNTGETETVFDPEVYRFVDLEVDSSRMFLISTAPQLLTLFHSLPCNVSGGSLVKMGAEYKKIYIIPPPKPLIENSIATKTPSSFTTKPFMMPTTSTIYGSNVIHDPGASPILSLGSYTTGSDAESVLSYWKQGRLQHQLMCYIPEQEAEVYLEFSLVGTAVDCNASYHVHGAHKPCETRRLMIVQKEADKREGFSSNMLFVFVLIAIGIAAVAYGVYHLSRYKKNLKRAKGEHIPIPSNV